MIQGVIFDLDGVLTATDGLHTRAWAETCSRWGMAFHSETAPLLRGVGRNEAARIVVSRSGKELSNNALEWFAEDKNELYCSLLSRLTPADVLPQVPETLAAVRARGIGMAVASASKNARLILERIGLAAAFDAIVDGTQITKIKPDPEVFLRAADALSLPPCWCLVVEDAVSGLQAARAIGCRTAAIGSDAHGHGADCDIERIDDILRLVDRNHQWENLTCCTSN